MPAHPERLLEKLFSYIKVDENIQNLDILVVCAGSFPSFSALQNKILTKFPNILKINYILVEPNKNKMHLFSKKIKDEKIKINFEFYDITLQEFLNKINRKFDIIYFEHPDIRTITIPLAKLCGIYKNSVSLRESIIHLQKICKPYTKIIASHMSQHENNQMKQLLKFSLGCDIHLVNFYQSTNLAFQHGLYCEIKKLPMQQQTSLHIYDRSFAIFTLFFVIEYSIIISNAKSLLDFIIPILLLYIIYHFHRPNKYALLLMFISQMILFIFIGKNI